MEHDRLLVLLRLLAIAHHIPGRVRIKLDQPSQAKVYGLESRDLDQFIAALRQVKGIRSAAVNTIALSCTVEYDIDLIPVDTWQHLLAGPGSQPKIGTDSSQLLSEIACLLN